MPVTPAADINAFSITTTADFSVIDPQHNFVGMGTKDESSGDIVPVASIQASPVTNYIYPNMTYWVATGDTERGVVMPPRMLGPIPLPAPRLLPLFCTSRTAPGTPSPGPSSGKS